MEILYFYVDQYKNLSGGYPLSGKYEFELSENVLKISKSDNYIESFFADNNKINISGIIGENGSGKTSIIKIITGLFYQNHFESRKEIFKGIEAYILLEMDGEFYHLSTNSRPKHRLLWDKNVKLKHRFRRLDKPVYSIYFNYMLDSLKDSEDDKWIEDIYHKADDYSVPCLLEPYKKNNIINISNLDYLTRQRMMLHQQYSESNKVLHRIFAPIKVKLTLDIAKLISIFDQDGQYVNKVFKKYDHILGEIRKLISDKNNESLKLNYSGYHIKKATGTTKKSEFYKNVRSNVDGLQNHISKKITKVPLYILNNLYIANKLDRYFDKEGNAGRASFKFRFDGDSIIADIRDETHATRKLRNAMFFQESIVINKIAFDEYPQELVLDSKDYHIPSWFILEFVDGYGRTLSALSSGEKALYIFMSTLLYQLENIRSRWKSHHGNAYKDIVLLLDETDLGLHPKWQRQYIYYLIESLKEVDNINFQIICTSHSPFIVSDIPKTNLLFLERGKKTDLRDSINTFGSNIHTLLHDSFFMQRDAMMGQFAEEKIKSIFLFCHDAIRINDEIKKLRIDEPKSIKIEALNKELDTMKVVYLDRRDFYLAMQKTVGENIIATAIKNNISDLDQIFGCSELLNGLNKHDVFAFIENNPGLHSEFLKRIK